MRYLPALSLFKRFGVYQSERFPFLQHAPLIVAFTFSAVSYSRISRNVSGFIPLTEFIVGSFTAITLFFVLRVFDEYKDAEEDARYRPYRPVPRGLISLNEVGAIGLGAAVVAVAVNAIMMPAMILPLGIAIAWMLLMRLEFFVAAWIRRHHIVYMLSHMMVMPMIDLYTTGLDWRNAGVEPPSGLWFFLAVTFMNGIVIEIGRKIRPPELEEEGVNTYSALYGARRATFIWIGALVVTCAWAVAAARAANLGMMVEGLLVTYMIIGVLTAIMFLRQQSARSAKFIEIASGVWALVMYLTLGAAPMLLS